MGAHGVRPDARPGLDDAAGAHVPEEYDAGAALAELRQGIDGRCGVGASASEEVENYRRRFIFVSILYFYFAHYTNKKRMCARLRRSNIRAHTKFPHRLGMIPDAWDI